MAITDLRTYGANAELNSRWPPAFEQRWESSLMVDDFLNRDKRLNSRLMEAALSQPALSTLGGFQSMWGKVYKYFPLKVSFLMAVFIFELGGLICGVAPNSPVLIVGRAIAGLGTVGAGSGAYTIIACAVEPKKKTTFNRGYRRLIWPRRCHWTTHRRRVCRPNDLV